MKPVNLTALFGAALLAPPDAYSQQIRSLALASCAGGEVVAATGCGTR
jgi:hypothetical protein